MENVLSEARKYFVQVNICIFIISLVLINCFQFKTESITATYAGQPRQITFEYRDPWKWILALIQDESLAPWNMWNAVRKFYCHGDCEERIYDEPNTGDVWWEVDVSHILVLLLL